MESAARAAPRPRSAQHFGICLAALAAALLALWAFPPSRVLSWPALRGLYLPIMPCLVVAAALVLGDVVWLRAGLRTSTGYAPRPLRARALPDVVFRLVGLGVTLGLLALAYWLVPEYQGTFYTPFWRFLKTIGPPFLVFAPFYFLWADPRMTEPRDAYWQLGRLVSTFSTADCDGPTLRLHFLGWGVKGFFLPLMVVFLDDRYYGLELSYRSLQPELMHVYTFVYDLTYALDVLFCVVGYTLTVRLFDSHMRSVEPTVRGWLVAIACYDPFYGLVLGARYFRYDDRLFWDNWLVDQPALRMVWAIVILVLLSLYTLSTIAFGLRFSNLTHRGIITNGPYRWSKHPAYLSKNLSWWLISIPFIPAGDALDAVRNCGLLLALNALYYLRARTEEWHLSRDPDYVAYAAWMEAHGPLRGLGKIFPFLRYCKPRT
ncbi:MAG: hypothetical protein HY749_14605 [Gammaproteobacteria bacterium]|nr:hypothetical protein [Gammaproteobacteria bacterium]MBI5617958.1 hypothetical protein [Gammaproteobacteria bacterium]